jgi:hypothetical protein
MASIFDLKTTTAELSSANQGTSNIKYEQKTVDRTVTGTSFSNGAMNIRWSTTGQKWWIPSRTYMRMRCRLTKNNGTQLDLSDQISPNYGLMSNLFQSGEFQINNKVVSRVGNFMPQIDSLDTRLSKSRSWMKSVGVATNWWDANHAARTAQVSSDGVEMKNTPPTQVADQTRLALGYDALTRLTYTAATSRLVFDANGGADPTALVAANFPVGSYIKITDGAAAGIIMQVSLINGPLDLTVTGTWNADLAQAVIDFSKTSPPLLVGDPTRQLDGFEMIWVPPLSIFKVDHALPSGDYELVLNPQTASTFQKRAIESLIDKDPNADFKFEVVDMFLMVATIDGPRADDITYLLDLEQTRCQMDTIQSLGAFQQRNFDVSPSTYALTAAFQDSRAGNLTQYSASKFQMNSPGGVGGDELKLNRMFINYSGVSKPNPDADPKYQIGNASDYTTQRYAESQIASGAYYDTGGAETIQEYHEAGSYYHFAWPRDGTDRSTRVNVHFGFEGGNIDNARILLFDHSKSVARVSVQGGRVVAVHVEEA